MSRFAASPDARSRAAELATPLIEVPGVGPALAEPLARLALRTVADLLFNFPRDYHDFTDLRSMSDLAEGVPLSVIGTVVDLDARQLRSGRSLVGVLLEQEGHHVRGVWFNQPFMRQKFALDQQVMFSGKVRRHAGRWEMTHPRVQWLNDDEDDLVPQLLPVYALTEGLRQRQIRRAARVVVERYAGLVEEAFPPEFLEAHRLAPIHEALPQIHFPADPARLAHARRRFVYQELFVLQLALAVRRQRNRQSNRAPVLERTAKIDARIRRLFPFELTAAQRQAIDEIVADLGRSWPMNRLLQGDVGSGKTVVAVYAMLLAVAHGYQALLMAPTEILARQHAATLERLLAGSQVRQALLTGGLPGGERSRLLADVAAGRIDLVIGTQAVLESDVELRRLGLVVIDEQHKFGVRQRGHLKNAAARGAGAAVAPAPHDSAAGAPEDAAGKAEAAKSTAAPAGPATADAAEASQSSAATVTAAGPPGSRTPPADAAQHRPAQATLFELAPEPREAIEPHYLVMTATPIPRTLTMTLFGDLDVSTLRESPPGRQKVHTYLAAAETRSKWWQFVRQQLDAGRQGYVVAPLIDESEEIPTANLQDVFDELKRGPLAGYRLGMLHGRLSPAEKNAVMRDFRDRELQVLVTTTVVEVGVDVPNATLMTIEGGERFGLSQLHQLRGRIARGKHPGYCCVFADEPSDESRRRLDAFVGTVDGFALAEADFTIRGPGELFGTRQHGLPPLLIADLVRDCDILDEARSDAQSLVAADPGLAAAEHSRLRRQMLARYGRALELGDVG